MASNGAVATNGKMRIPLSLPSLEVAQPAVAVTPPGHTEGLAGLRGEVATAARHYPGATISVRLAGMKVTMKAVET